MTTEERLRLQLAELNIANLTTTVSDNDIAVGDWITTICNQYDTQLQTISAEVVALREYVLSLEALMPSLDSVADLNGRLTIAEEKLEILIP